MLLSIESQAIFWYIEIKYELITCLIIIIHENKILF
jgi:hypothetical protein